jgi:hypothetical protein
VLNHSAGITAVARVPVARVDFVPGVARFVVVLGDPGGFKYNDEMMRVLLKIISAG